jgi:hypothetical protein
MNRQILQRKDFSNINRVFEYVYWFLNEEPNLTGIRSKILSEIYQMGFRPTIYRFEDNLINDFNPLNIFDYVCVKIFHLLREKLAIESDEFEELIGNNMDKSIVPLETIYPLTSHYNIDLSNFNINRMTFEDDKLIFYQSTLDENINLAEMLILKEVYANLFNKDFDTKKQHSSTYLKKENFSFLSIVKYFLFHIPLIRSNTDIINQFGPSIKDVSETRHKLMAQMGIQFHSILPGQSNYFFEFKLNNHFWGEFSVDFLKNSSSIFTNRLSNVRIQVLNNNDKDTLTKLFNNTIVDLKKILGTPPQNLSWTHQLPIEYNNSTIWEFDVFNQKYSLILRIDKSNPNCQYISINVSELMNMS